MGVMICLGQEVCALRVLCLVYIYEIGDCLSFCPSVPLSVCRVNRREVNLLQTSLVKFWCQSGSSLIEE